MERLKKYLHFFGIADKKALRQQHKIEKENGTAEEPFHLPRQDSKR